MEAFTLSLNAVFPIFFWMVAGYAAKRLLGIGPQWVTTANAIVFRVFMPALLFTNMLNADLAGALAPATGWMVAYVYMAMAVIFLVLMLVVPRFIQDNPTRGSTIQAMFRSNTALFGLPIALALYQDGDIGAVAIIIAAIVPLLNVLCVVCLERFRGEKIAVGRMLKNIVTNPLILGTAAGLLANLAGLHLPQALGKSLAGLAGAATPFAFLVLGAGLSFSSMAAGRKTLLAIVLTKLVLVPAACLAGAVLLGFRGQPLAGILVVFAPPTAVNSYSMACSMGGNPQLSGEAIAVTSLASVFTMFLWIMLLKSLALL